MPSVIELTEPYANFLLPVLPASPSVCPICHTSISGDWSRYYQCNQALRVVAMPDAVLPLALAVKGKQLAYELAAYKSNYRPEVRAALGVKLAALLWRRLADHERCLAAAAGMSSAAFDLVAVVPSTSGRAQSPLQHIVGKIVGHTQERYEDLLSANPDRPASRAADPEKFIARRRLSGERVLLIDDTWTTGGHALSAAHALRSAGAGGVGVAVIGRHFTDKQPEPYREAASEYLRTAERLKWSWSRCCLER